MNRISGFYMLAAAGVAAMMAGDAAAMMRSQISDRWNAQAAAAREGQGVAAGDNRGGIAVSDGRRVVTGNPTTAGAAPAARQPAPVSTVAAFPGEPPVVPDEQRVDLHITFETNSAFIRPQSTGLLAELCAAMTDVPASWTFNIVGHADASGTPEVNRRLSAARAREVSRYLNRECGIDIDRLSVFGLGNSRLLPGVPPVSEENRRVEVSINSI